MGMKSILYLWVLILISVGIYAQTNTNSLPGFDPSQFPTGDAAILAFIPPITAFITWLLGKIPPLPKGLLPWITPALGVGVGYLLQYINGAKLSPALTAAAGGLAVFIYEAAKSALVDKQNPSASIITPTVRPTPPPGG
jgi:hypothetical protein